MLPNLVRAELMHSPDSCLWPSFCKGTHRMDDKVAMLRYRDRREELSELREIAP